MFQWTATHIINTAFDNKSQKPRWVNVASTATITNADGDTVADPLVVIIKQPTGERVTDNVLQIKRAGNFFKSQVTAVYKRVATAGRLPQATFTIPSTLAPGNYQIALGITLSQNQNSNYARSIDYRYGKPLYFTFQVVSGDTVDSITNKIIAEANRLVNRFGDQWVTVSKVQDTSGASPVTTGLTFTGMSPYQMITTASIQGYASVGNPCSCNTLCNCDWFDITPANILQSIQPFGTYEQIRKDLRLPTLANTNWLAVNADEQPVVGALYNQYTIQKVVDRGIQGTDAVGDKVTSSTNHVFYVNQNVSAAFETALTNLGVTLVTDSTQPIESPFSFVAGIPKATAATAGTAGDPTTVPPTQMVPGTPGNPVYPTSNGDTLQ